MLERDCNMELALQNCTIGKVIEDKAKKYGDRTFLTYVPDGRTYSYRDLDILSTRIANGLVEIGIGEGVHVAVIMENCPEQFLLYLALGKIGAVSVPINTSARGRQLGHLLNLSDATTLVTETGLLDSFDREVLPATAVKRLLVLGGIEEARALVPADGDIGLFDFAELASGSETPIESTARFCDVAFLAYTSGTTGPSKLNVFPHAHCILYALNNAEEHDYRDTDVAYVCLPMFHISALFGVTFAALLAGGTVVMTRRFSRTAFWDDIRGFGVTLINSLGAMSEFIWNQPPSPEDRNHKIRLCRMVPVPRFAAQFEDRFGLRIVSGYGLSDFGQVAAFTARDPREKLGSPGRPRRGIELRIVDEDDLDVAPGSVGEIVVRTKTPWNMAQGYYKMPEATLAAMRNMWFHTGDCGYLDAEGYLYFTHRKKDAMRRRGENISAVEVEQIILEHPAVLDAAVYAVRAESSEDEVAATIVLRDKADVSERELIEHCVRNMAYYMVPRYIRFATDLPRTLSHRVQKFKLIEDANADLSVFFDREKEGIVVGRKKAAG